LGDGALLEKVKGFNTECTEKGGEKSEKDDYRRDAEKGVEIGKHLA
jgi:hypothetical protein